MFRRASVSAKLFSGVQQRFAKTGRSPAERVVDAIVKNASGKATAATAAKETPAAAKKNAAKLQKEMAEVLIAVQAQLRK